MRKRKIILTTAAVIIIIGFAIPQNFVNPVKGATNRDYNAQSYWYYPWGKSGTHKGVDIFAKEGTSVNSSTGGLVIFQGKLALGGNVVLILGPKWRLHYYAHLEKINTDFYHGPASTKISELSVLPAMQKENKHIYIIA